MDLRLEASKLDPFPPFVYRRSGLAVGVIATHNDDLLGRGERDILHAMGEFPSTRSGTVTAQTDNFAHIGMDVPQEDDGSVANPQTTYADLLRPIAASPSLWKDRNSPLSDEELQICQGKLGEPCWLATASRPDICARLARFSANLKSLKVIDICRINDLIKTVKKWQSE